MSARRGGAWWACLVAAAVLALGLHRMCGADDRAAPTTAEPGARASDVRLARTGPAARDAALPVPPAGELRLEGEVVDDANLPIGGAHVSLDGFALAAVTSADGSFAFDQLASRDYSVRATASDDVFIEPARVKLTAATEPIVLRAEPAIVVIVHVLDADSHAPIVGAREHRINAVSDVSGILRLVSIPLGGSTSRYFSVDADGYESGDVEVSVSMDALRRSETVVELHRGVPVSGKVLGPADVPIAGARVLARGRDGGGDTLTAADGTWRIPALAAGMHDLAALADGYAVAPDLPLDLDGVHPRAGVVFHLEKAPTITISGTVVDASGTPQANATVSFDCSDRSWTASTDSRGAFQTSTWYGVTGKVTIVATTGRLASDAMQVTLATKSLTGVRVVVAESTISGTVVDSHDRPIAGALVTIRLQSAQSDRDPVTTDRAGRFEIVGVPPGEWWVAAERVEQPWTLHEHALVVRAGQHDVKLALPALGAVTGRLLLDGAPVPRFSVYPHSIFGDSPPAFRSDDGRFALRDLEPGQLDLFLVGPTFARTSVRGAVVAEGGTTDLGDIIAEHGVAIHGRVTDTRGAPIVGAVVSVRDALDSMLSDRAAMGTGAATTDAGGEYRIDHLAPSMSTEPRHLLARHAQFGSVERLLTDSDSEIDLVLVGEGGIDGEVANLPGAWAQIHCARTDDSQDDHRATVERGRGFRFDHLTPGEYRCVFNAPIATTATVTVVGGERAHLVMAVPAGSIEVKVRATTRCNSVSLEIDEPAGTYLTSGGCVESTATFLNTAPGTYRACVDRTGCTPITVAAEPAAQTIELH